MSLVGRLLISRPILQDPNFDRTISLVLEHGDDGALGVILNRPSTLEVGDPFPDWQGLAADPPFVFGGGPVERNAMIVLGRSSTTEGELALGLHSVDLDHQPQLVRGEGIEEIRIFAGYAGWGGGQLEGELANGAWWMAPGTVEDVFCPDPYDLWARVLRREGGEMAWFAHLPEDPTVN